MRVSVKVQCQSFPCCAGDRRGGNHALDIAYRNQECFDTTATAQLQVNRTSVAFSNPSGLFHGELK